MLRRERQGLGFRLYQANRAAAAAPAAVARTEQAEALAGGAEHLGALVDAHHLTVAAREQLGRDETRSRRHIQHPVRRTRRDRAHERPPPARILSEAERGREDVVASR